MIEIDGLYFKDVSEMIIDAKKPIIKDMLEINNTGALEVCRACIDNDMGKLINLLVEIPLRLAEQEAKIRAMYTKSLPFNTGGIVVPRGNMRGHEEFNLLFADEIEII